jgi:hypothetical protein
MTLRSCSNRVKRLEKIQATTYQTDLEIEAELTAAREKLANHPEGPGLVLQLASFCERNRDCRSVGEFHDRLLHDNQCRELLARLSEIFAGLG